MQKNTKSGSIKHFFTALHVLALNVSIQGFSQKLKVEVIPLWQIHKPKQIKSTLIKLVKCNL